MKPKRKGGSFTAEVKGETVRLIRETGRRIAEVAKDLDLTESAIRLWVKQAAIDAGHGPAGAPTTVECDELTRLRRENNSIEGNLP